MKTKDNNGKTTELHVHSGGYLYYNGKDITNQITETTSHELSIMNIKTDKNGNRYIQKGGQKKLYIDNAILTDKNNILVKDYLNAQNEYEVTFTFKTTVQAPDKSFAENKAFDILVSQGLPQPINTTIRKI